VDKTGQEPNSLVVLGQVDGEVPLVILSVQPLVNIGDVVLAKAGPCNDLSANDCVEYGGEKARIRTFPSARSPAGAHHRFGYEFMGYKQPAASVEISIAEYEKIFQPETLPPHGIALGAVPAESGWRVMSQAKTPYSSPMRFVDRDALDDQLNVVAGVGIWSFQAFAYFFRCANGRPRQGYCEERAVGLNCPQKDECTMVRVDSSSADSAGTSCNPVVEECEQVVARSSVLANIVASPMKPEFDVTSMPSASDPAPGEAMVMKIFGVSKPIATWRWLKDNEDFVQDPRYARRFVAYAEETTCEAAMGNQTNSSTSSTGWDCSAYETAVFVQYTLAMNDLRRTDGGEYQLVLSNYLGDTLSAKISIGMQCDKCEECVPNSKPMLDAYDSHQGQGCVCNDGFYRTPVTVGALRRTADNELSSTLLGFKCSQCPEGAECFEDATISAIHAQRGYFRANANDTLMYPCTRSPPGACRGGNISTQCSDSSTGVLCHKCADHFHLTMGKVSGSGEWEW
jgi:hypothetical protein